MEIETLYDTWASRNPQWETRFEDFIKKVCNYGVGENSLSEARSKLLGAGYELFIIAFFIGLYSDRRRPLINDSTKRKNFGWAIENWGNIERRSNNRDNKVNSGNDERHRKRKSYPKIREYIFAALVARTDLDFIALDCGEISLKKAVDALITTMEEYANFGFHFIKEKNEDNPNWLFNNEQALLEVFLSFNADDGANSASDIDDDEPESLD